MDNEQIKSLMDEAWKTIANVQHAVRTLTAENPLILFNKDTIESDDDTLYELPFGYYVGKYEYYNEGTIWKVHGDNVTIMLRGEEFGDLWELTLDQLPFESVVSLLEFLIKK
jgi:hypothetical protein